MRQIPKPRVNWQVPTWHKLQEIAEIAAFQAIEPTVTDHPHWLPIFPIPGEQGRSVEPDTRDLKSLEYEMSSADGTDLKIIHPAISLIGRLMFTLVFFASGITHFTNLSGFVALMPDAIPFREFWVVISAVVELAGALMILANIMPRLGGWLIVVFLIPVTIVVHGAGIDDATDPRMAQIQISFLLKGIAMTGAALLITQLGVKGKRVE